MRLNAPPKTNLEPWAVPRPLKPQETRKFRKNVVEKMKIWRRERETNVRQRMEAEFGVAGFFKPPKIENLPEFYENGVEIIKILRPDVRGQTW